VANGSVNGETCLNSRLADTLAVEARFTPAPSA
jgi:hypothetical protein